MQVTTRVKTGTARAFPSTLTSSQITFSQPSTSSGHAAHHDVRSSALPRHSSHNHHQPCPSCSASWSEQQQQLQQRLLLSRKRSIPCRSINEVVSGIAGVDPGLLQVRCCYCDYWKVLFTICFIVALTPAWQEIGTCLYYLCIYIMNIIVAHPYHVASCGIGYICGLLTLKLSSGRFPACRTFW